MTPAGPDQDELTNASFRTAWWALLGVGIVMSLVMVWRSQLQGDQLNMLIRGWYFAFGGQWLQVGMPTSAGGVSPGGLLPLVVGAPLKIWADDRAATVVVWLSGILGYLLLDRVIGRALGPSGRLLFAVFYWLNPWRMHFTSSLWNTNYAFFIGGVHAWCAYRLRRRPRFWSSMALVLLVGLGFQLHGATAVFAFVTVLLWWRRLIRVNWWGVSVGVVATTASYLPWVLTAASRTELLPGGTGFPFRNLVLVQPFLRGVAYLLRYPSLSMPGRVYDLDLVVGNSIDDPASLAISSVLTGIGWLSLLLPIAAYRRLWAGRRRLRGRRQWAGSDRLWLRGYVAWSLAGGLAAFAFSPTSVMFWQGFPVFHAAVLVVVFFVAALLRSQAAPRARRVVVLWLAASLFASAMICWASPMFRTPGPPPEGIPPDGNYHQRITTDHPMFHDLNLIERHRMVIVDEGGYAPDLLREASAEGSR